MILLILITILICLLILIFPFERTLPGVLYPNVLIKMNRLPGPSTWPFFGIGLELATLKEVDLLNFLMSLIKKFPRICKFWVTSLPEVLINEPEDIEVILSSVKYINKGYEYFCLEPWLKDGLLLSKGNKWHKRRKLLTPTFHFKILQDNLSSLNNHSRILLKKMLKNKEKAIDVHSHITLCTLDIIGDSAMGIDLNAQENKETDYVKAIKRVTRYIVWRSMRFWLSRDIVFYWTKIGQKFKKEVELLHKYTEKIIEERKEEYAKKFRNEDEEDEVFGKKRKAFLDSLIEMETNNPNTWSIQDIREEVDTFMFEGHDTTSSALTFSIYLLALHQDIQEKVYQEQYSLFGVSDREVTNRDLNEMVYLEKVIKESLRLYPSVPFLSRWLTCDAVLNDGKVIPKLTNVIIIPYAVHRNAKYFPDPEVFDPERFNPDECAKRHPYSYIPFSAGPRNCIGQKFAMMELKMVLSTLVRFLSLKVVNKEELKLAPLVILRATKPVEILIAPRAHTEKLYL